MIRGSFRGELLGLGHDQGILQRRDVNTHSLPLVASERFIIHMPKTGNTSEAFNLTANNSVLFTVNGQVGGGAMGGATIETAGHAV